MVYHYQWRLVYYSGMDLGFVKPDNVRVTGQIIAAGAGVAIEMETVLPCAIPQLQRMIIDSPNNVAISVRAEGNTKIGKAFVRTSAYLEETVYNGNGFQVVEIDGEEGARINLRQL